jgi:hypothetical protein
MTHGAPIFKVRLDITLGFERRLTLAFTDIEEYLIILRILYAGRSLDPAFD